MKMARKYLLISWLGGQLMIVFSSQSIRYWKLLPSAWIKLRKTLKIDTKHREEVNENSAIVEGNRFSQKQLYCRLDKIRISRLLFIAFARRSFAVERRIKPRIPCTFARWLDTFTSKHELKLNSFSIDCSSCVKMFAFLSLSIGQLAASFAVLWVTGNDEDHEDDFVSCKQNWLQLSFVLKSGWNQKAIKRCCWCFTAPR